LLDFKSTFVAGLIGAAVYYAIENYFNVTQVAGAPSVTAILGTGFMVGVGVQLGVRMLGVS
jgi:hypothetical protein